MDFIIIGGLIALAVVAGIKFFSRDARLKRALRKAKRVRISDARDGEIVKIVGTLRYVGEPLRGSLSDRKCAYYQTTVEQKKSNGNNNNYWETIISETRHCDFFEIEDGDQRVLVDLSRISVVINIDRHRQSGFLNDATPKLERLLRNHGESSRGWLLNKTLRYREGVLEQGEQVAVLGLCRQEPDPEPNQDLGYRERAMRLVIGPPPGEQMLISDETETF